MFENEKALKNDLIFQNSEEVSLAQDNMGWRRDELLFQREVSPGE